MIPAAFLVAAQTAYLSHLEESAKSESIDNEIGFHYERDGDGCPTYLRSANSICTISPRNLHASVSEQQYLESGVFANGNLMLTVF